MTDTDTNFFQLKNKIINCNRKAKTSKTNYLAHTRQNIESFLSQMLYIISLNLKQSWMSHCVCIYITCVHLMQHTKRRMTVICCASLHSILTSNKVCITCQSLAHTVQAWKANWWKALHLHCRCYTLRDSLKTTLEQINASKCSVVLRNLYRRTPNIDWNWIHTQIIHSVSLIDASIHSNWQKIIWKLTILPKFLFN